MTQNSNETIRHLIHLANDRNLDLQSRKTINDVARFVSRLQVVSQRLNDLDTKLQEFRSASKQVD